ncbi:4Fe-4S dicluster domain-containing protein [Chloroflexota bacterium]
MKSRIIKKKDIPALLDKLIQQNDVFAPVSENSVIAFNRIESGSRALIGYQISKLSPKNVHFPQSEALFRYKIGEDQDELKVPVESEKALLIFGIRPCDAFAETMLDKVFQGKKYSDPYYVNRRAKTTVVSIGCIKAGPACFCTSVDGAPFSTEGSDVMLIDIGDEYVLQPITDKGTALLQSTGLAEAPDSNQAEADKIKKMDVPMSTVKTEGLKKKLDSRYEDAIWQKLNEKCLSCGICTYLCPTCHCFDILDEQDRTGGERIRLWDSCQFPQFTLQASGINPRPTNRERMRQRIMHKFSYFIDDNGLIGCVGCGRCVTECPVNLDIREILNTIAELEVAR